MKMRAFIPFLLLFILPILPATADAALKNASFAPLWSPQAQFAGYYVAKEKGIYQKHGIELKIIASGPDHPAPRLLQNGEADFAVLWLTTALQQSAAGVKLINVAQLVQKTSMMLIAKKSSGINIHSDLQGKKIGLWGGDLSIPPRAFFAKYHLLVQEVPQSYTVNLFLRGGCDVTSAMWYNEYHTIINSGFDPDELTLFFLKDSGINFPEDGLYTLEKTYRNDPALVDAFVRASLEGWRYAFDHPEEAVDIVLSYMKKERIPANRSHQQWMLERMRDLILPGEEGRELGQLQASDYQATGAAMQRLELIESVPDFQSFIGRSHANP